MMWRRNCFVLFCLVLCALYCFQVYAADYTLSEEDYPPAVDSGNGSVSWLSSIPDDDINFDQYQEIMAMLYPSLEEDEDEDYSVASGSNARLASSSNAFVSDDVGTPGISLYSSYTPYDSSISTSVIAYMSDVLPKLGNVDYVLFRHGQYSYRLVYADQMEYTGGDFSAATAEYVAYDSRYYTWSSGSEGSFTLRPGNYIVYSNLGAYPMLDAETVHTKLLLFLGAVFFLFVIYRSIFHPGKVSM